MDELLEEFLTETVERLDELDANLVRFVLPRRCGLRRRAREEDA
ncbi:MAG TPA: hypothetical protein VMW05_12395 [Methyloceanibacter sp.]|nr:hypothetical protein [Methyloceanibacter sp.]